MARFVSMKMKTVKVSIDKPNRNPPSGDKSVVLETDIYSYKIEYSDKN